MRLLRFFALFLCLCPLAAYAQTVEVGGAVHDPSGAVIPKASVEFRNQDTGIRWRVTTNAEGFYHISTLDAGKYDATVRASGFKTLTRENITFQVGDKAQIDFAMQVGQAQQSVTVNGSGQTINTTDAAVGAVIDRQFVEDIPLNGRSFQPLIMLSPGVVPASPQGSDNGGEYSVNGQRTTANNFTLDGASAMNVSNFTSSNPGSNGALPSSTALGTTQAIISIDALQEFRISTSTYSAEYGQNPGAQVAFVSRSGTNEYHGTLFDYIRNYAFDADNWFNTYSTQPLPTPQEHQNDFGGVFGGPVSMPGLFSGKDRAFFFFSYEGIRLDQPQPSTISWVPSNGTFNSGVTFKNPLLANMRANAVAAVQPLFNAFPLPNCDSQINPQCVDYGDGLTPVDLSEVNPASLNSWSLRTDYQVSPTTKVFARYADTESASSGLYVNLSHTNNIVRSRTYFLGADSTFRSSVANQLRLQYSPSYYYFYTDGKSVNGETPINGQQTPNLRTMQGLTPAGGKEGIYLDFGEENPYPRLFYLSYGSRQFQPNATDNLSWAHAGHLFKAGATYRQTTAYLADGFLSECPYVLYMWETGANALNNQDTALSRVLNCLRQNPTYKNFGTFIQDEWRVTPRWSLSVGLRWELDPPPSVSGAQQYTYTGDINNPSTVALSALGAPVYKTTYTDFQPRLGMALVLHNQPGHELVLRVGGGLFYDTGQDAEATFGDGVSLGAATTFNYSAKKFPIPTVDLTAPVNTTPTPPYSLSYIMKPDFRPPSTLQWSVSLEQALGSKQSMTLRYVGTQGRDLSTLKEYSLSKLNPLFSTIEEYENGPGSIYNALQASYNRRPYRGLQILSNYTWSHAIDSASTNYNVLLGFEPPQRGNGDHDIRNYFNLAAVYNVPGNYAEAWKRAVLANWNVDLKFLARSAFPVQPQGPTVVDPTTGDEYPTALNYNGMYPYLHVKGIPGGRQFNPAVFSTTLANQIGNAPRNFLRGFGQRQADMAIQRSFPLYESMRLQFRAEAFNITNHPNFGAINVTCGATTLGTVCNNPLFGQATATLNNFANSASGVLASIYQSGGPRSMQFALKLKF